VLKKNGHPLYVQVQHALAQSLAQGVYAPGDTLPNERALAQGYGVSIGTLRAAVNALVQDGRLIRQQGRGTFVAEHDRDRLRFYFYHVVEQNKTKETYPEVGLVAFNKVRADSVIAGMLGIERNAPVFHLRNRVSLGGEPVNVDDIWLCAKRFVGLEERTIRERRSTLYELYQTRFALTVVRTSERLRASACARDHAALLRKREGDPVLEIRRCALAYDGAPIEWRVSTVNTDRHEYANELTS
jgi:GntR family transcriptional regulator